MFGPFWVCRICANKEIYKHDMFAILEANWRYLTTIPSQVHRVYDCSETNKPIILDRVNENVEKDFSHVSSLTMFVISHRLFSDYRDKEIFEIFAFCSSAVHRFDMKGMSSEHKRSGFTLCKIISFDWLGDFLSWVVNWIFLHFSPHTSQQTMTKMSVIVVFLFSFLSYYRDGEKWNENEM